MPIDTTIALDVLQGLPVIFALAGNNIPMSDLLMMILSSMSVLDSNLLLFINGHGNAATDTLMLTLTNRWVWVPFYCLLAVALFFRKSWRRALLCLCLIALAVTIADQACATLIRPVVGRLRPSNPDNPLSSLICLVDGYRGGRYGFPSCHAANSMALVVMLALYFRNRYWTIGLCAWALLQCYTRLYLGVHYPSDILCGMAVGATAALICYAIGRMILHIQWRAQSIPIDN